MLRRRNYTPDQLEAIFARTAITWTTSSITAVTFALVLLFPAVQNPIWSQPSKTARTTRPVINHISNSIRSHIRGSPDQLEAIFARTAITWTASSITAVTYDLYYKHLLSG